MSLDASSPIKPTYLAGRQTRKIETPTLNAEALQESSPKIAKLITSFQNGTQQDEVALSSPTAKETETPEPKMLRKFHQAKEEYRQKQLKTGKFPELLKTIEQKLQRMLRL